MLEKHMNRRYNSYLGWLVVTLVVTFMNKRHEEETLNIPTQKYNSNTCKNYKGAKGFSTRFKGR